MLCVGAPGFPGGQGERATSVPAERASGGGQGADPPPCPGGADLLAGRAAEGGVHLHRPLQQPAAADAEHPEDLHQVGLQ